MTNVSRNQNWALIFKIILVRVTSFKTVLTILAKCCADNGGIYVSTGTYCREGSSNFGGSQPTSKAKCESLGAALVEPKSSGEQTEFQTATTATVCIDLFYFKCYGYSLKTIVSECISYHLLFIVVFKIPCPMVVRINKGRWNMEIIRWN